jgi:hypothetical protein
MESGTRIRERVDESCHIRRPPFVHRAGRHYAREHARSQLPPGTRTARCRTRRWSSRAPARCPEEGRTQFATGLGCDGSDLQPSGLQSPVARLTVSVNAPLDPQRGHSWSRDVATDDDQQRKAPDLPIRSQLALSTELRAHGAKSNTHRFMGVWFAKVPASH